MNSHNYFGRAVRKLYRFLSFSYRNTKSKFRARQLDRQGGTIRLELGSHIKRSAFYTVDLSPEADLVLDLLKPIPFSDNRIDQVYSSHVLEHFSYKDLITLLGEVHRVLKPAAAFKIVVPDASLFVNGYVHFSDFDLEHYIGKTNPYFHFHGKLDVLNYVAFTDGEHKFMFDEENLVNILKFVGFRDARLREFDPSLDLEVRRLVSIHAVAIK